MADKASRMGQAYATPQILKWTANIHHRHDSALERAFLAPAAHGLPEIQLGPAEARLLHILLQLSAARTVVEIGTLAGYSALQMVRALPSDGHLWTLEVDPRHAKVARDVFEDAGVSDRITVIEGDALESLSKLSDSGPFCVVFLDADKARYDRYGRWAAEHLREGGLLIGDNAFLFGDLLEEREHARAMRRFHQEMAERFVSVTVPTPDGLAVGIKRSVDT